MKIKLGAYKGQISSSVTSVTSIRNTRDPSIIDGWRVVCQGEHACGFSRVLKEQHYSDPYGAAVFAGTNHVHRARSLTTAK